MMLLDCRTILILSSLRQLTDAWQCSRCSRTIMFSVDEPPLDCEGCFGESECPPILDCEDCLDEGGECVDFEINDEVVINECVNIFSPFDGECPDGSEFYCGIRIDTSSVPITLPFNDLCEWRDENGRDLSEGNFLDCSDWEQYDQERGTDFIGTVNSASEFLDPGQFRCYPCNQRCTRVFTCGDSSYACNHLFDIAVIQFNAESDSSCRSLIPLDGEQSLEYCNNPHEPRYTIDCGGLCDLEDDEDIFDELTRCPNGEKVDSYWTVCSDDQAGEYARILFSSGLSDDLKAEIGANTDLLEEPGSGVDGDGNFVMEGNFLPFYDFGHYSCVDLGEVTCEATSESAIEATSKSTKSSKKKGKKAKGKKTKDETCRRNLRPKNDRTRKKTGDC